MTLTYSTQTHLFPWAGGNTENTSTGDGLHSYLVHDLAEGANNLVYTDPCATFVYFQGIDGSYANPSANTDYVRTWPGLAAGGMNGAVHIASPVVMLPSPTTKMRWTLGVRATSNVGTVTISEVRIYLDKGPYLGPSSVTGGVADLFSPYSLSTTLCTSAAWSAGATGADTGYVFTSAQTNEILRVYNSDADASANYANAVIVATMSTTGNPSSVSFYCYDLTMWSVPE